MEVAWPLGGRHDQGYAMGSEMFWFVPVVPGALALIYVWYAKAANRTRRRAASVEKRRKNIAHEQAWKMIRGRNGRKRITYRGDGEG